VRASPGGLEQTCILTFYIFAVVSKKFPVYLKSVGSLARDEHSFPIRRQNIRSISSITIFLLLIEVGSLKSPASTSFSFIVVRSPSCWHSPPKCRPSFAPHSFCFLSTSRNPARTCFTPRGFYFHGTHSCATMHHVLSFFITSRADRIGEAQTKACSSRRRFFSSATAAAFPMSYQRFLFLSPSAIALSSFTRATYRVESSFQIAGDRMELGNQILLCQYVKKRSPQSTFVHSLLHNCTFSILHGTLNRSAFRNVHLCVVVFLIHGLSVGTMVTEGASRNDVLFIVILYINASVLPFLVFPHCFSYQFL
jgi:hypothetical protein